MIWIQLRINSKFFVNYFLYQQIENEGVEFYYFFFCFPLFVHLLAEKLNDTENNPVIAKMHNLGLLSKPFISPAGICLITAERQKYFCAFSSPKVFWFVFQTSWVPDTGNESAIFTLFLILSKLLWLEILHFCEPSIELFKIFCCEKYNINTL